MVSVALERRASASAMFSSRIGSSFVRGKAASNISLYIANSPSRCTASPIGHGHLDLRPRSARAPVPPACRHDHPRNWAPKKLELSTVGGCYARLPGRHGPWRAGCASGVAQRRVVTGGARDNPAGGKCAARRTGICRPLDLLPCHGIGVPGIGGMAGIGSKKIPVTPELVGRCRGGTDNNQHRSSQGYLSQLWIPPAA